MSFKAGSPFLFTVMRSENYVPAPKLTVENVALKVGTWSYTGVKAYGNGAGLVYSLIMPANVQGPTTGTDLVNWADKVSTTNNK